MKKPDNIFIDINGVKHRFINRIEDMNIDIGMRVMSVHQSDMERDIKNKTILSILCDCDVNELYDNKKFPPNNINLLIESLPLFDVDVKIMSINAFKFNHKNYSIIDFDNLTVSEYADIDSQIKNNEYFENLNLLVATMYRSVIKRKKRLLHIKININKQNIIVKNWKEIEYNKDLSVSEYTAHCELFKELPFVMGLYCLNRFLLFKQHLQLSFPTLFNTENNTIYKDEFDIKQEQYNKDNADRLEESNNVDNSSFYSDWNIYHIVSFVSNDIKSEIDYWYNKNILELYTHYSYIMQKQKLEINKNK